MTSNVHITSFHYFTSFPEDIRRLILEIAFEEGYPRANHLSVLSREVNSWIKPLVYRYVSLCTLDHDGEERFLRFINMFRYGSRGKDFYTDFIKVIFIDDVILEAFAVQFLPSCRYLVSLSCWPTPRSWSNPLDKKASEDALTSVLKPEVLPYLRRLSIPILQSGPLHAFDLFSEPLAQNLTHVDFLLGRDLSWDGLGHMSCLQYLSVQPVMDLWLPSDYPEAALTLGLLVECVIPFLPPNLRCFLIWLPTTMIVNAAHEDTRRKMQDQIPLFASLVHGWLDSRIILASSDVTEPSLDSEVLRYFRDEVDDFKSQTIMLVNRGFDSRLVWDNSANQGGDQLFWGIERILRQRQQAAARARRSHWHSTHEPEPGSEAILPNAVLENFCLFNSFPEDIRRLVFEIAFEACNINTNHLALVSQETQSWVEPLIYRHILLCHALSPRRTELFVNTICHGRKRRSYYASLIQCLSIDSVVFRQLRSDFLLRCENIISFAGSWSKWSSEPYWDDVLRSILKREVFPRMQKLSLQDIVLPDVFIQPACHSLTHLDICLNNQTSWEGFKTLPSLKHIRIDALRGMPVREDLIDASQDVRMFIEKAVFNFPPTLESFVFCVGSTFALAAAIMDCNLKVLRGQPTIFADIVRGGIDSRVVLSCKSSPLINWSDKRVSQRQVDEIYDFLNQLVPHSSSLLPWDSDCYPRAHEREIFWLDVVKGIIHQRNDVTRRAGAAS